MLKNVNGNGLLPNKKRQNVPNQGNTYRRMPSAEEAFVKTNIDMPTKELTAKLAERFGKIVTEKAVTRRKAKLRERYGIPARPKKPWTKEEDDYIVQHYNRMSAEKIGIEIKRTRAAVEARVILLKGVGNLIVVKDTTKNKIIGVFPSLKEAMAYTKAENIKTWEWL